MTPRQLLTSYSFQSLFRSEAFSEAGIDGYRTWIISVGIALFCFHLYLARFLAAKYAYLASLKNVQRSNPPSPPTNSSISPPASS